eukprot:TRINITY_DN6827_c0_g1_i4.p1 TRINITY_DN6827_c0_g1~~TRINITY_DN6827_c0_g1_i4.p1  ORF type:complete len:439 (-),score=90.35 TRINITY_DN6827_c0_g1_i4:263-1579(-)
MRNFTNAIRKCSVSNKKQRLQGLTQIRALLCDENEPNVVQNVVESGVVPGLVELLNEGGDVDVQLEAIWILGCVATGTSDQTRVVVKAGALPQLSRLLRSKQHAGSNVREKVLWTLGNIAGDSVQLRNKVLKSCPTSVILDSIRSAGGSFNKVGAWLISNMSAGDPAPSAMQISPVIPFVLELLESKEDDGVLLDATCAFRNLCGNENLSSTTGGDELVTPQTCKMLVNLMQHKSGNISEAALSAACKIASKGNQERQMLLDAQILPALERNIVTHKRKRREETCKCLLILAAGESFMDEFFSSKALAHLLLELISTDNSSVVAVAIILLKQVVKQCSRSQLDQLNKDDMLGRLFANLQSGKLRNSETLVNIILLLETVLKFGESEAVNPFVQAMKDVHGDEILRTCGDEFGGDVCSVTVRVLDGFFRPSPVFVPGEQ